jgi:hypothetical protein
VGGGANLAAVRDAGKASAHLVRCTSGRRKVHRWDRVFDQYYVPCPFCPQLRLLALKAHIISTDARVRWRTSESDGEIWARIGDYELVNPVITEKANTLRDSLSAPRLPHVALTHEQEVVFTSQALGFVQQDLDFKDDLEGMMQKVTDFLLWCRYLTFQHEISSTPRVVAIFYPDIVPSTPSFPSKDNPNTKGAGPRHLLENCVTQSTAEAAAQKVNDGTPVPVHHHLFVDAYAAYKSGDFRQSVLFAAMSAESLAAATLEASYRNVLASGNDKRFRISELETAGGNTVRKDPVYEAIATRTNLSSLLHERPP